MFWIILISTLATFGASYAMFSKLNTRVKEDEKLAIAGAIALIDLLATFVACLFCNLPVLQVTFS